MKKKKKKKKKKSKKENTNAGGIGVTLHAGVFIVNFEHISHPVLFLMLTLRG